MQTCHPIGFPVVRSLAHGPDAPTVLLIHGFLDDLSVWDGVIDGLGDEVATVRYDLPEFGRRAGTVTDTSAITLAALAAEAGAVIDSIAGPVIVVGQSLGSQVAELAAAAHPDQVRGLVLLTPVPLGGTHLPAEVVAQFQSTDGDSAAQRAARGAISPHLDDAQLDRLTDIGRHLAPGVAAHYVDVWNNGVADAPATSAYRGPVLVIRGGADGFVTAELVDAIAGRFVDAEIRTIESGGHWLHVEFPEAVAAMIQDFAAPERYVMSTSGTTYPTLRTNRDGRVLDVEIDAPPMNLIGPTLVRDLVALIGELESDTDVRVLVLSSADPDFFVPHVDLTKVAEYTAEAAKAGDPADASLGMLFRKLSELPVVTIAKLRGRARGAGSELALACDMRFAARENAVLGQPEIGFGAPPGAGGIQHLARLLGRGRAMEALLGAADFTADEAERYGWINRALPDDELDEFVAHLARRIASFPADGVRAAKQVLNELTLPAAEAVRADAKRFRQHIGSDEAQARTAVLFDRGLQTRGDLELNLADHLERL